MIRWRTLLLILIAVAIVSGIYLSIVVRHGFSAADQPSAVETVRGTRYPTISRE